ncbi:MAG TPA: hypothetical protein VHQ97_05050 [Solirubrobacterales bacterium]|nr:hypothetical protein [Solirubrobacterales bacterium]
MPGSARAAMDDFGLEATSASLSNPLSGSHSDLETRFLIKGHGVLDERDDRLPWADLRRLAVELPPGLVGNPSAFPSCDEAALAMEGLNSEGAPQSEGCPQDAQVGVIEPGASGHYPPGALPVPLFNLTRPPGSTEILARLGFMGLANPDYVDLRLDPRRDYAVTATVDNVPSAFPVTGAYMTLWGVPTASSHDGERFNLPEAMSCGGPCSGPRPSTLPPTAFLSDPTACRPLGVGLEATSYQNEDGADYAFPSAGVIGDCQRTPFEPSLSVTTTTGSAGAPSGLDVRLDNPQPGLTNPNGRRSGDVREAIVALPQGVALNASVVDGLGSCSEEQIGVVRGERQIVNVGGQGAPVVLSLDGHRTAPLPAFATADTVRDALEALPGVGSGGVQVRGRRGGPWTVDFTAGSGGLDASPIAGIHGEMQQIVVEGGGGTFTLSFEGETTDPIGLGAQAPEVQAALDSLAGVPPGGVRVIGGPITPLGATTARSFDVAFEGPLADVDVPQLVATGSLTGWGSIEASTLTEAGLPVSTQVVQEGGSLAFDGAAPRCPESSKLASGVIRTPMLPGPLSAALYLADQGANPAGSMLAAYLVASGEGLLVKFPAKFELDPDTGAISATFSHLPQLPFSTIELHFKGGNRGVVTTPRRCGTYRSRYELLSWAGGPPTVGSAPLAIGSDCERRGLLVHFSAGSTNAVAGAFSSFGAQLTRPPTSDRVSRVSATLPPGLSAKLSGVAECSDSVLAGLGQTLGTANGELRRASCPVDSRIGFVSAGFGSGLPFFLQTGAAYLAGPYAGAPLSLALVVPAATGPFDLGNIVVRVAISIDPATGQVHLVSDPLPELVAGVPLELRDMRIMVDRPGFMINPTNCAATAVNGAVSDADGGSASVSDRFQVGDCAALPFRPRVKLGFSGPVLRNGHPKITVRLRSGIGDANLANAAFTLPPGELLDLHRIRALCGTDVPPERCPSASRLGYARLRSPLLEGSLEGPIYLREPAGRLPGIVVSLRSERFHLVLHGTTSAAAGQVTVTFRHLPDIPLSAGRITFAGARRGIIVNSESLCAGPRRAGIALSGQSGVRLELRPRADVGGLC